MAKHRSRPHQAPDTDHREPVTGVEQDEPLGTDDRVLFYPLEPDEVLRRLLRVPPVQRRGDSEPPDEDAPAEG